MIFNFTFLSISVLVETFEHEIPSSHLKSYSYLLCCFFNNIILQLWFKIPYQYWIIKVCFWRLLLDFGLCRSQNNNIIIRWWIHKPKSNCHRSQLHLTIVFLRSKYIILQPLLAYCKYDIILLENVLSYFSPTKVSCVVLIHRPKAIFKWLTLVRQ